MSLHSAPSAEWAPHEVEAQQGPPRLALDSRSLLSDSERDTLFLAARGEAAKVIAMVLGVSQATVSNRLRRAAAKLGRESRTAVVRLAAETAGIAPAPAAEPLTLAEREVGELICRGYTNRQIAKLRGRSLSTVAKQVSALLQKTRAPGRRALAARWSVRR